MKQKLQGKIPRRPTAAALSLLLIMTAVVSAMPVGAATPVTSWSWNAPADADGPGAFRVTADFGETNRCDIILTGTSDLGNGPAVHLSMPGPDYWASAWAHHFVQAHSSDLELDTREVSGVSGLRLYWYDPVSGTQDLTVLVSDMSGDFASGSDPYFPAQFQIDCDAPFEIVGFEGSSEVGSFNDMSLDGTGADAGGFIVPGISVNVEDTFHANFAAGTVEVDIWDWASNVDVRSWTLTTPSQSFGAMSSDLHIVDGPGDYLFSLTGVADAPGSLMGWMAGYNDVASLDEILS